MLKKNKQLVLAVLIAVISVSNVMAAGITVAVQMPTNDGGNYTPNSTEELWGCCLAKYYQGDGRRSLFPMFPYAGNGVTNSSYWAAFKTYNYWYLNDNAYAGILEGSGNPGLRDDWIRIPKVNTIKAIKMGAPAPGERVRVYTQTGPRYNPNGEHLSPTLVTDANGEVKVRAPAVQEMKFADLDANNQFVGFVQAMDHSYVARYNENNELEIDTSRWSLIDGSTCTLNIHTVGRPVFDGIFANPMMPTTT